MEIFLTKTRTEARFHPDRSSLQIPNLTLSALTLSYAFFYYRIYVQNDAIRRDFRVMNN